MKPLIVLAAALALVLAGCHHRHHNTSFSVRDNGSIYQINASYNPSKTKRLQHYLDNRLGESSNVSFVNTRMDATITLDDETKFYIKSNPGSLKIKFNKRENTEEAYEKMRGLCEGIKEAIH
jgi:uncharacterized lipoprotein YehR (DUF1307 family)